MSVVCQGRNVCKTTAYPEPICGRRLLMLCKTMLVLSWRLRCNHSAGHACSVVSGVAVVLIINAIRSSARHIKGDRRGVGGGGGKELQTSLP